MTGWPGFHGQAEATAAIAFAFINSEVPLKLNVRNAADVATSRITLKHALDRDLKAAGRSIAVNAVDEVLARI